MADTLQRDRRIPSKSSAQHNLMFALQMFGNRPLQGGSASGATRTHSKHGHFIESKKVRACLCCFLARLWAMLAAIFVERQLKRPKAASTSLTKVTQSIGER
jgi:hypothetical protein